jgi:hypothetical protein
VTEPDDMNPSADRDAPATKRDLEPLATKAELEPLATTAELEPLATKAQLEAAVAKLATKAELEAAVAKLATKAELAAAIAPLATKAELAAAIAPLATKAELRAAVADLVDVIVASEHRVITTLRGELAGHVRAVQESVSSQVVVVDDKYKDLPARVERLEAVVFPPAPRRTKRSRRG